MEALTHAQAQGLLPGYAQGSLSRDEVRALHQHFKACEACRAHIRLSRAAANSRAARPELTGLASPEQQAQMARNRDLLVKVLILLVFGYLVSKFRR